MTNQAAYARYHSLYDNDQYRTVNQLVAEELAIKQDSEVASDVANLITDAALGLCGHDAFTGACNQLALFCGSNNVSPVVIEAIYRYLLVFQQAKDRRADDFEALAKTLFYLQTITQSVQTAVAHASDIHSWEGRTGYHLLASAGQLLQTTHALLTNASADYAQEKLKKSITQLNYALNEAAKNETAGFSGVTFPTSKA